MKRKNLIINVFFITSYTMVIGFLNMIFRVYLSNKIGSEGMGLFQLIMSINVFACTISISGIRLTLTRLVAEEVTKNNFTKVRSLLKCGIFYTLFFSTIAALTLYNNSIFISEVFIGDIRAKIPLQILSFSLPFVGIASCLNGYFYGLRKVIKSIISDFIENLTMICIVAFFVTSFPSKSLEFTCSYITLGMTLGNIIACFCSYLMYLLEKKNLNNSLLRKQEKTVFREILSVSLPIAGSAYIQTSLKAIEDILIPKALKLYCGSSYMSLSILGVIKGMALPLINFPSIFLASFSTLIIPEIAQYNTLNKQKSVNFVISKVIKFTFILSIFATGFFIAYSNKFGNILYNNEQVGIMIKILAPLIPFMYLDRIVDGSLNALNQQVYTLKYNLIDMTVRIMIINTLIPRFGINGFISVLFISSILNTSLSVHRLLKVTKLKFHILEWILKPAISVSISTFITYKLFSLFKLEFLVVEGICIFIFYILFLFLFNCLNKRDIMWFVDAFKNDPEKSNWKDLNLYRQI